ncbi:GNAT family acetyltransferase [bacterium 336/3]|nr:GNAT family acetyltransferase [bacterium 336/3]
MIQVHKINDAEETKYAIGIREQVFVIEQKVPKEDEYDSHEQESHHFLAYYENMPCGTARWRYTEKGIKLERFAVLEEFRDKKVGKAILENVLNDIKNHPESKNKALYLHAQIQVVGFYEKFGFQKFGEPFQECDIWHYKMQKLED